MGRLPVVLVNPHSVRLSQPVWCLPVEGDAAKVTQAQIAPLSLFRKFKGSQFIPPHQPQCFGYASLPLLLLLTAAAQWARVGQQQTQQNYSQSTVHIMTKPYNPRSRLFTTHSQPWLQSLQ